MPAVSMTVNGKAVTGDVEARTLLVQFLRENLRLTGTHVGCDTSQCGACVVHIDDIAAKACTTLALQCEGAKIVTIEGLAEPNGPLHPMQEAFREHHGLQCGFCTPGMIMAALDIVRRRGNELVQAGKAPPDVPGITVGWEPSGATRYMLPRRPFDSVAKRIADPSGDHAGPMTPAEPVSTSTT